MGGLRYEWDSERCENRNAGGLEAEIGIAWLLAPGKGHWCDCFSKYLLRASGDSVWLSNWWTTYSERSPFWYNNFFFFAPLLLLLLLFLYRRKCGRRASICVWFDQGTILHLVFVCRGALEFEFFRGFSPIISVWFLDLFFFLGFLLHRNYVFLINSFGSLMNAKKRKKKKKADSKQKGKKRWMDRSGYGIHSCILKISN